MTTLIQGASLAGQTARAAESARDPSAPASFAPVMAQTREAQQTAGSRVSVQRGDTLVGLVQGHLRRNGAVVAAPQALMLARQVAVANGIANPNLIRPGQVIDLAGLRGAIDGTVGAQSSRSATPVTEGRARVSARSVTAPTRSNENSAPASTREALAARGNVSTARSSHPVLERTLKRAVDKGYIPAVDLPRVKARIADMARTYNFSQDDFARVALMESDGLNPRASNGRCHGIIQFCEGPGRGAASVDMAGRAESILDLSVLTQLDLTEKYFQDAGLRRDGSRNGLADLYLTVLTPAARAQRNPDVPLNVAGPQASALHLGRDQSAPITRASLTEGLVRNAAERLARPTSTQAASVPTADRPMPAAGGGESWPGRLIAHRDFAGEDPFESVE